MKKFNDIMKEIGQALASKKFWVELLIMTLGMFMVFASIISSFPASSLWVPSRVFPSC